MGLASNNLLNTIKKANESEKETRMAKVTAVSGTTCRVQFYGEETASSKYYKKLSNLSISANDTVIMTRINGTYIITGRI